MRTSYIYHPLAPSSLGTIYRINPEGALEFWDRVDGCWCKSIAFLVSWEDTWAEPTYQPGDN